MKKIVLREKNSKIFDISFFLLTITVFVLAAVCVYTFVFTPNASDEKVLKTMGIDPLPVEINLDYLADTAEQAVGIMVGFNELLNANSYGSGSIISSDGIVLTNYHVIAGKSKLEFILKDKGTGNLKHYDVVEVINYSHTNDLALVRIKGNGEKFPALKIGNSNTLKIGEEIKLIGTPGGEFHKMNTELSTRIIEKRDDYGQTTFLSDAGVIPGYSGGPVVNRKSEVVAVITGSIDKSAIGNTSLVDVLVPINMVMPLLKHNIQASLSSVIDHTKYAERKLLGFETDKVSFYSNSPIGFAFRQTETDSLLFWEHMQSLQAGRVAKESSGYMIFDDYLGNDFLAYKVDNAYYSLVDNHKGYYLYGKTDFFNNVDGTQSILPVDGDMISYDKNKQLLQISSKRNMNMRSYGEVLQIDLVKQSIGVGVYIDSIINGETMFYDMKDSKVYFANYENDIPVGKTIRIDLVNKSYETAEYVQGKKSAWTSADQSKFSRYSFEATENKTSVIDNEGFHSNIEKFINGSIRITSDKYSVYIDQDGMMTANSKGTISDESSLTVTNKDGVITLNTESIPYASAKIDKDRLIIGDGMNNFSGKGAILCDECLYIGELQNSQVNGNGRMYYKEYQTMFDGVLLNGKPNGPGGMLTNGFYAYFGYWEGMDLIKPYTYEYYQN